MLIQIVLLAGIVVLAAALLRRSGARHQAIRRLALLGFGAFAVTSVVVPDIWNELADVVGVGRGTDLLLYGTIMVLLGFITTSYMRFRDLEHRFTKLSRRIALDEVPAPGELAALLPGAPGEAEGGYRPSASRRASAPAEPGAGDHLA
ncbi:DUF2304 family protein [Modestobacter sp. SYSU DS0875]